MKELYNTPRMELVMLEPCDVIRTSGEPEVPIPGENETPFEPSF